jgi:hypothetical protein
MTTEIYLARFEELQENFGATPGQHINLNVTNDCLFSDIAGEMVIPREFNHDAIHELIAKPERIGP